MNDLFFNFLNMKMDDFSDVYIFFKMEYGNGNV